MFHLVCFLSLSLSCGLVLSGAPTFHGNEVVNCGGVYTEDEGTFQSPGRPHRRYCVYEIIVLPGRKINLQFPTFNLRWRRPRRCSDWLRIYDGDDLIGGPFCGKEIAPDRVFTSKTRKMTVVYRRVGGIRRFPGFRATYKTTYTFECGYPVVNMTPRSRITGNKIVGGDDAKPGSHPWQVLVHIHFKSRLISGCGGALLDENWVLTTAHCFDDDPKDRVVFVTLYLGVHDLDRPAPFQTVKIYNIHNIIQYPEYEDFFRNDIALLKLESPVSLNEYVIPICLPEQGLETPDGTVVTVTGWGRLSTSGGVPSILQQADIPVMSDEDCEASFNLKYNTSWAEVMQPRTMICIYKSGVDPCFGDSGGPLVVSPPDGPAYIVGLVSFGWYECASQYPNMNTKVSAYVDWIRDTMTNNP